VDGLAGLVPGHRTACSNSRLHHPVGQTVAAESGQPHQIYIFCIMAVLQMFDQSAKGSRGSDIGYLVGHVRFRCFLFLTCHETGIGKARIKRH
jgi:hypothetical protein